MYECKHNSPRCRTLTSVYDAILEDLVFPAEIVGKRIRVKNDGSQMAKVHLDKNQQTTIEHKVMLAQYIDILTNIIIETVCLFLCLSFMPQRR